MKMEGKGPGQNPVKQRHQGLNEAAAPMSMMMMTFS
jgi:hypothetical protein